MKDVTKLFDQAQALRVRSKFREAALCYEGILRQKDIGALEQGEAHLGAGDCLRLQGDFEGSKRHARQAETLFRKVDSPRLVDARVSWALALRASGSPRAAVDLLRKALRFYESDGDLDGIVFAHWALGGTLRIAGDLLKGWEHLKKAEKLYKDEGDKEGLAYTHCALGGLARMLGRFEESGRHYLAANRLHRARKDSFGTAYSYCGLGNVERMNGRYESALVFFRKAEKLYKRIGDKVSYAYTLWSIGTTHKLKGSTEEAARYFDIADKLFKSTGDLRGRSYAALGRAELLWMHGRDGEGERKKAEAFAKGGGYAWELLHAKLMKGGKPSKAARKAYQKMGSKFSPTAPPINWP